MLPIKRRVKASEVAKYKKKRLDKKGFAQIAQIK